MPHFFDIEILTAVSQLVLRAISGMSVCTKVSEHAKINSGITDICKIKLAKWVIIIRLCALWMTKYVSTFSLWNFKDSWENCKKNRSGYSFVAICIHLHSSVTRLLARCEFNVDMSDKIIATKLWEKLWNSSVITVTWRFFRGADKIDRNKKTL